MKFNRVDNYYFKEVRGIANNLDRYITDIDDNNALEMLHAAALLAEYVSNRHAMFNYNVAAHNRFTGTSGKKPIKAPSVSDSMPTTWPYSKDSWTALTQHSLELTTKYASALLIKGSNTAATFERYSRSYGTAHINPNNTIETMKNAVRTNKAASRAFKRSMKNRRLRLNQPGSVQGMSTPDPNNTSIYPQAAEALTLT